LAKITWTEVPGKLHDIGIFAGLLLGEAWGRPFMSVYGRLFWETGGGDGSAGAYALSSGGSSSRTILTKSTHKFCGGDIS
jgi:hypothetical protein